MTDSDFDRLAEELDALVAERAGEHAEARARASEACESTPGKWSAFGYQPDSEELRAAAARASARRCLERASRLDARERGFVQSMTAWRHPSIKQRSWLAKIERRLFG
jgi:hypothetical protein